ncbi:addiction module antidote protein [Pseudorhodoplanes sinuspersici]|uniref:Putative addiction module antidote protein n=1 Tax=Pseudorhodoplanes sinuspersici TaxID=1235591 RepID=A0A1W7A0N9_9HYPH|nr:addiction module antidote protein [Pseudorhodoplanes sinuspersici]ARQ02595.1 putative addiction module antidote protein [Pseudorhodoplanes sinuspersici]RKE74452.1 putative addiction module antidote protein [Pseudorhodoplanes sinuspersici]
MALKTYPWDPVDELTSEKEIQAYLAAALEDGDPALVVAVIGDIARARGMGKVAKDVGVSREALYKSLSPSGNPGFITMMKVAEAVGLKFTVQPAKRRRRSTPALRAKKTTAPKRRRLKAG